MKQGRRLYRNEKEILRKQHLNPEEYSFLSDSIDKSYFRIQHKQTGVIKTICRFNGRKE